MRVLYMVVASAMTTCAAADDARITPLEPYEPTTLGFTWDSDDVRFLDFKLSVKFPFMPERLCSIDALHDSRFYFAATARFAQYLGTRDSSPVIGKRFNPKFIWRQLTDPADKSSTDDECKRKGRDKPGAYFDVAFGHESNGQSVDSLQGFEDAVSRAERPAFARDNISRGWDYLELITKKSTSVHRDTLSGYLTLKYFLPRGPLQGVAEEYNVWENDPEGKPRRRVHGISFLLKYQSLWDPHNNWFRHPKFALGYETGYSRTFRHNTLRGEIGGKFWEIPITAFAQTGYGNDLALYYKKASSVGAMIEIASF